MATRVVATAIQQSDRVVQFKWTGLLNGDDGEAIDWAVFADRSVQVVGTFGAGGSVRIEGSNDGTNFVALTDPQGNALDITAAKIEQLQELALKVRPRVTAGDGSTNLTVLLLARKG